MLLRNDQQSVAKAARIFVGIKIAPDIAEELAQLARGLERFPTRFVPTEDIHLTLVPPWDETSIPDAIEKLRASLNAAAPFMLTFTRLAYWPNRRRPRLLCAECVATDEIEALQQALLNAFGQTEDKPFQPHVTLARMQRGSRATAGKTDMDRELSLVQPIDSVELFQSRTQADKNYQILASLPLAAPQPKWRDILRQSLSRITGLWMRVASKQDRESSRSGASKCCNN
jgi:2'-5' RNA ligase